MRDGGVAGRQNTKHYIHLGAIIRSYRQAYQEIFSDSGVGGFVDGDCHAGELDALISSRESVWNAQVC